MDILLLSFLIGIAAATLDVIPMVIKKLPKSACISAFLQYLFVGIIIVNTDIPYLVWWLEGICISLAMAIPIVIIIAGNDKKVVPIILTNAVVLGGLISLAAHFLK